MMVMHQNKGLVCVCVWSFLHVDLFRVIDQVVALTWEERSEVGQD